MANNPPPLRRASVFDNPANTSAAQLSLERRGSAGALSRAADAVAGAPLEDAFVELEESATARAVGTKGKGSTARVGAGRKSESDAGAARARFGRACHLFEAPDPADREAELVRPQPARTRRVRCDAPRRRGDGRGDTVDTG